MEFDVFYKTLIMKTLKLLFAVLLMAFSAALSAKNLAEALVEVNVQWARYPGLLQRFSADEGNYSDQEIIQRHLLLVHDYLAARDASQWTREQQQNRREGLEHLLYYAERGIFPINQTNVKRQPVFIDPRGVHCAVGYIIKTSGHEDLSCHISAIMNYNYLKDMHDPALTEWIKTSGFTFDELAWIQPSYPTIVNWETLKNGINGPVNAITQDNLGNLVVGGSFDSAGTATAHNLAQWVSGFAGFDWYPFEGSSFDGPINDVVYHNGKLYVAGDFSMVDTVYTASGVVMYDGDHWNSLGQFYIGALNNYVLDLEFYRDTLYAGGFFKGNLGQPGFYQSIAKWNGQEWENPGITFNGEVRSLLVNGNKLIIGGDFTTNGSTSAKNICILNGSAPEFFDQDLPIAVNAVATYNNEVYVATDLISNDQQDTVGLAVYRNNSWQRLSNVATDLSPSRTSYRALQETPYGLVVGGDFIYAPLLGDYGKNLAYIKNDLIHPLGILDSTVNSFSYYQNGGLVIGGDFTHGIGTGGTADLNHIVSLYLPDYMGQKEFINQNVKMYPNPVKDFVWIKVEGKVNECALWDATGKKYTIDYTQTSDGLKVDMRQLPSGVYIVKGKNREGAFEQKLIKD